MKTPSAISSPRVLQVKGQFPDDAKLSFNKMATPSTSRSPHGALHGRADYAMRQVMSVQLEQPPPTRRYYARDQRTLTSKFTQNPFNTSPIANYPLLGFQAAPTCATSPRRSPSAQGSEDARPRGHRLGVEQLRHRFHLPLGSIPRPPAGRYRILSAGIRCGAPGGRSRSFAKRLDTTGKVARRNRRWGTTIHFGGRGDEPSQSTRNAS